MCPVVLHIQMAGGVCAGVSGQPEWQQNGTAQEKSTWVKGKLRQFSLCSRPPVRVGNANVVPLKIQWRCEKGVMTPTSLASGHVWSTCPSAAGLPQVTGACQLSFPMARGKPR